MENEIRERDVENKHEEKDEKSVTTLQVNMEVKFKKNYLNMLIILWMIYLFCIGIYLYVGGHYGWMIITDILFGLFFIVMCIRMGVFNKMKEEIMSNVKLNAYTIM
jgi:hypothetical protein